MLIDTHCHLNFDEFKNEREKIIARCFKNDIWLINIGTDYETSKKAVEIAEKYKEGVYASIALHPHNVQKEKFDISKYQALAKSPKVVAIGEAGLDYALIEPDTCGLSSFSQNAQINTEEVKELQKKVFVKHLELAKELDKPIIIHCRRLFPEILEIVKEQNNKKKKIRGVLHCYMGRWSYAQEFLKMGFYLSFTGLITYARDYDKVVKNTPLERILIETDAPYLTPVPHRGQRNLPLYVKYVAEKIADLKELSFEKVAEQTTKNARDLFGI